MNKYRVEGVVLGKLWGSGFGAYPSSKLYSDTKTKLLKEAKRAFKDGDLDSGMGFEYLKGALLYTTRTFKRKIDDKDFYREETDSFFLGELTKKEKNFLFESVF